MNDELSRPMPTRTPRRVAGVLSIAIASASLVALQPPSDASAGTITVASCGDVYDAGNGLRNGVFGYAEGQAGWQRSGDAGQGANLTACDTNNSSGYGRGLWADLTGAWGQRSGVATSWKFYAPADTTIKQGAVRIRSQVRGWNGSHGTWGDVSVTHSQLSDPNYLFRTMGAWSNEPLSVERVVAGTIAGGGTWFGFNAGCGAPDAGYTCPAGGDSIASVLMSGSLMEIEDTSSPQVVGTPTGSLFSSRYLSGIVAGAASISDKGVGLYRITLQERRGDGSWVDRVSTPVDTNNGRCVATSGVSAYPGSLAFTSARPCKTEASGDVSLNTNGLPEGPLETRVVVTDAAGNQTTLAGQETRYIDRTAPTISYEKTDAECYSGIPAKVAPEVDDAIAGVETSKTTVTDANGEPVAIAADGTITCPAVTAGPLTVTTTAKDKAGNARTVSRPAPLDVVKAQPPEASTPLVPFLQQALGTISSPVTVRFTAKATRVDVRRPRVIGQDPDAFTIGRDECSGETLRTGESCTVTVRFTPDARRKYAAQLVLDTLYERGAAAIELTGIGGELPKGASAYELWLAAGNRGSLEDFLAGLRGTDGVLGAPGASVVGPKGEPGTIGLTGAAGAPGPQGIPGNRGQRGQRGEQGIPGPRGAVGLRGRRGTHGPLALYRCQPRKKHGRYKVACFVEVVGDGARDVRVRITRAGRVVATGRRSLRTGQHRVQVRSHATTGAGHYDVRVTVRQRGRARVLTGTYRATAPAAFSSSAATAHQVAR